MAALHDMIHPLKVALPPHLETRLDVLTKAGVHPFTQRTARTADTPVGTNGQMACMDINNMHLLSMVAGA